MAKGKIKPQEYEDPQVAGDSEEGSETQAPAEVETQEGETQVETGAENEGDQGEASQTVDTSSVEASEVWAISTPAPVTIYEDMDSGGLTRSTPVRGHIVVRQGSKVTPSILRRLGKEV